MKKNCLSLLFLLTLVNYSSAQTAMDTYFAVNSLCHHLVPVNPTPTQETSAPHWMYFLAREAGHDFTTSGNFMSPVNANDPNYIPFQNNWLTEFDSIPEGWNSFVTPSLAQSPIDNVVITPMNFIQQYQTSPTMNYGFIDSTLNPISGLDVIIDYVRSESTMPVYIYEGWNDMGYITNGAFPPTSAEYDTWINATRFNSTYHDWFLELHDSVLNLHPNHCVKMIPVGPIIGELLNTAPYNSIAVDTLFEDDAPHGRPSIYFIAGMITYMALFEERPPASYQPPAEWIAPEIIANYSTLIDEIWGMLIDFDFQDGTSRVFCNPSIGLPEPEQMAFRVFPNPASTQIRISAEGNFERVVLRNSMGAVVSETQSTVDIDISHLAEGMYFIELQNENLQTIGTDKLIIN